MKIDPMLTITIENKYHLLKKIGQGSFGSIYKAKNKQTDEYVAIKIEENTSNKSLLHEAKVYKYISDIKGFPKIRLYGNTGNYTYMILDLLGYSLDNLKKICGGIFSLKTTLLLAIQMLRRIENLHNIGIIHRDLKPDNFMVSKKKKNNLIYLIDFGLAKFYRDKNGAHIPMVNGKKIIGTVRYSSIHMHEGVEQSRRDDLESLGYIFVYFLKGRLPWQGLSSKTETTEEFYNILKKFKQNTSLDKLCKDIPEEFKNYLEYCRKLKFDEKPNYTYLMDIFFSLFKKKKFDLESRYDWLNITPTEKKNETKPNNQL